MSHIIDISIPVEQSEDETYLSCNEEEANISETLGIANLVDTLDSTLNFESYLYPLDSESSKVLKETPEVSGTPVKQCRKKLCNGKPCTQKRYREGLCYRHYRVRVHRYRNWP